MLQAIRDRERIEELEETILQLKASQAGFSYFSVEILELTRREMTALEILRKQTQFISRAALAGRLQLLSLNAPEVVTDDNLSVVISRLRKKLLPLRVGIKSVHGFGYIIPPESKKKLDDLEAKYERK